MEQSFNLLKEWINSEEFQESIIQMDNTKKIVENARNQLTHLETISTLIWIRQLDFKIQ